MDVVCFIMACEVERQAQKNDKLKQRIKEMDDKLLDRNSYEKRQRIFKIYQSKSSYIWKNILIRQKLRLKNERGYVTIKKILKGDTKKQQEIQQLALNLDQNRQTIDLLQNDARSLESQLRSSRQLEDKLKIMKIRFHYWLTKLRDQINYQDKNQRSLKSREERHIFYRQENDRLRQEQTNKQKQQQNQIIILQNELSRYQDQDQ